MLTFLLVLPAEVWSGDLTIALGMIGAEEAHKSTILYPAAQYARGNWIKWVPHIPKFVVTRKEKFERAWTAMDWFDWASIGSFLVCQELVRVVFAETVGEWYKKKRVERLVPETTVDEGYHSQAQQQHDPEPVQPVQPVLPSAPPQVVLGRTHDPHLQTAWCLNWKRADYSIHLYTDCSRLRNKIGKAGRFLCTECLEKSGDLMVIAADQLMVS